MPTTYNGTAANLPKESVGNILVATSRRPSMLKATGEKRLWSLALGVGAAGSKSSGPNVPLEEPDLSCWHSLRGACAKSIRDRAAKHIAHEVRWATRPLAVVIVRDSVANYEIQAGKPTTSVVGVCQCFVEPAIAVFLTGFQSGPSVSTRPEPALEDQAV
jgi:hypothetical protein